jgi:hypothetical protein
VIHHPLQLLDRLVDQTGGDDGGGEHAPLIGEGPLLRHPLVEGVNDRGAQLRVVTHPLLHQAGQRRQHDGVVDALLVHEHQPRLGSAEGVRAVNPPADDLPAGFAVGIPVLEVLLLGAGTTYSVERRVGDVVGDLAPHHDLGTAVDIDIVDGALVLVGQVPGQRIARLVHVVVGIEDPKTDAPRGHASS